MTELILAEFKGTYRAPHPDGIRDANVTKPFHVKVKMKRSSLKAPGLNGLFATYYQEFVKKLYPDMIELYMFETVQATELDGSIIDMPKALSHQGLIDYIKRRDYPINALLYTGAELRNQVVLYEEDNAGQQFLEQRLTNLKGNMLATAAELQSIDDLVVVVDAAPAPVVASASNPVAPVEPTEPGEQKPAGKSIDALLAGKGGKGKAAQAAGA